MRDVGSDGHMDGNRDSQTLARGKQREVLKRKVAFPDVPTDRFPDTQTFFYSSLNGLVDEFLGFPHHAKRALAELVIHLFRSMADHGHLEVMDETRAVDRDPAQNSLLHPVNQDRGETEFD